MTKLLEEIAEYEDQRDCLETELLGKWVIFRDRRLQGSYDDFQDAAASAVERFGRGPYLIRQVGAPPIQLPASLRYRPATTPA